MKIEIASRKEKPLLNRAELALDVTFQGATPSKADLRKSIAAAVKGAEELLVIRKVGTLFGASRAKVSALLYADADSLKRYEPAEKKPKEPKKEEAKE